MTEAEFESLGAMEYEAKVNFLVAAGLFPACGHHRVVASKELAEEDKKYEWVLKWHGVKVLVPPAGRRWENAVRILGFHDNLKQGLQMTFAESMEFLRREYVEKYMLESGKGYKEPAAASKAAFRKRIAAVLETDHSQTIQTAEGLLARPPATYTLVRRVLKGDVEKPEIPFNPVGGATTLHHLAKMPNSILEGYLLQVVQRKHTTSEVNAEAKASRSLSLAREHIARYLHKHYPEETEEFEDWAHFTQKWPTLEALADLSRSYWHNPKGKAKERSLPELDRSIERKIKAYQDLKEGKAATGGADVPFLTAPATEEKVVVLRFQNLQFVLLNCQTEAASKWLKPHDFGLFLLLLVFFLMFVLLVWVS